MTSAEVASSSRIAADNWPSTSSPFAVIRTGAASGGGSSGQTSITPRATAQGGIGGDLDRRLKVCRLDKCEPGDGQTGREVWAHRDQDSCIAVIAYLNRLARDAHHITRPDPLGVMGVAASRAVFDLLRIVAKYRQNDAERARALAKLASNLRPKRAGMAQKNRARLLQFDSEQNQLALLRLPERVLKDVRKRGGQADRGDALRVMWAVAVEILIMAPMRVKSLIAMEPGRHFVDVGRGRYTRRHIIIPKEETKTNVAFEMRLPDDSCAIVDEYLDRYRPLICKGQTAYLFPNSRGERRSAIFSSHLSRFVWKETGLKMNPHLFRHLAGKFYLEAHPQQIETVRQFLGHKTNVTTERSYVEVRAERAFRNLDAMMLNRRDEASRLDRAGSRNSGRRP